MTLNGIPEPSSAGGGPALADWVYPNLSHATRIPNCFWIVADPEVGIVKRRYRKVALKFA